MSNSKGLTEWSHFVDHNVCQILGEFEEGISDGTFAEIVDGSFGSSIEIELRRRNEINWNGMKNVIPMNFGTDFSLKWTRFC